MLQERLMMLGLGDVFEHDFTDRFRVGLFDEKDDIRHEELARLDDDLRREFIVRDPERIEREERVERVVDDDAAIVDLVVEDAGRAGSVQHQGDRGYDHEYTGDEVAEYECDSGERERNQSDRPIPVRSLLDIYMLGCIPGDECFGSHTVYSIALSEDLQKLACARSERRRYMSEANIALT